MVILQIKLFMFGHTDKEQL